MTEREKNALAEAFGFEEPDRKKEFADEFRKLDTGRNSINIFPAAVRFAASAAMLAAVTGTVLMIPKHKHNISTSDIPPVTAAEAAPDDDTAASTRTEPASDSLSTTAAAMTAISTTATTSTSTAKTTSSAVTALGTAKAPAVRDSSDRSPVTSAAVETTVISSTTAVTVSTAAAPVVSEDNDQKKTEKSADTLSGHDMTVSPDNIIQVREKVISEDELLLSDFQADLSPYTGGFTVPVQQPSSSNVNTMLPVMYKNSSIVALANLDEIVYTSIDGAAYTAENITVEKVLKGSLKENDRITVFFRGGYLPAEEYIANNRLRYRSGADEYSVIVPGECRGSQIQGRKYIFFLSDSCYPLPEGSFTATYQGDSSVFENTDGTYTAVGDSNMTFTEQQAENGF